MLRTGVSGTIILLLLTSTLYGQAPVIQWQRSLGGYNGDYPQSVQQTSDGGYVVAGYSLGPDGGDVEGYHGNVGLGDLWVTKLTASGALQWERCYGGVDQEVNAYVRQTADGGYVLAGSAASSGCGMPTNHGGLDYWLLKLSPTGDIQWQTLLGGSGNEYVTSLNPTPDGSYIIGGYTSSSDGQVTGYHPGGVYNFDWWIVKVDGTGNLIWEKTLGGSGNDQCIGVALTGDGGCIATGWESSTDGDVTGNHGNQDAWMVKLDASGGLQWEKAYGGTNPDGGNAVLTTPDGGYIFSGFTASNNGDVSGNHQNGGADEDLWVVKTDATGTIQWQKCYGGTANEEGWAMAATVGGGYVLTVRPNRLTAI